MFVEFLVVIAIIGEGVGVILARESKQGQGSSAHHSQVGR